MLRAKGTPRPMSERCAESWLRRLPPAHGVAICILGRPGRGEGGFAQKLWARGPTRRLAPRYARKG